MYAIQKQNQFHRISEISLKKATRIENISKESNIKQHQLKKISSISRVYKIRINSLEFWLATN